MCVKVKVTRENSLLNAGVGKMRPAGKMRPQSQNMWPAKLFS